MFKQQSPRLRLFTTPVFKWLIGVTIIILAIVTWVLIQNTFNIEWARAKPFIDQDRIGLWGASQAGWVIPNVVKQDPDIAFSILVSPAINWITQGRYNTRQEMLQKGYREEEITARQIYNDQVLQLIRNKATYNEYMHLVDEEQLISKERWTFIVNNVESDATDGLASFIALFISCLGVKI